MCGLHESTAMHPLRRKNYAFYKPNCMLSCRPQNACNGNDGRVLKTGELNRKVSHRKAKHTYRPMSARTLSCKIPETCTCFTASSTSSTTDLKACDGTRNQTHAITQRQSRGITPGRMKEVATESYAYTPTRKMTLRHTHKKKLKRRCR